MKLNIEFVKRNLISIIVAGSILTVGGISFASTLLSDPSETIAETTQMPTATLVPTLEPTLEPTIAPTVSPNVAPAPLVTPTVIILDGVTINAVNSVINAKDSVVNNPNGTTATAAQAPTPPVIQPTKPTPKLNPTFKPTLKPIVTN